MKYLVVKRESGSIDTAMKFLEIDVNMNICYGWKLQGGISITLEPQNEYNKNAKYYVAQAMVYE